MSTSDSIDYNLNAGEVIRHAVVKLNLLPAGQTIPAEMQARAVTELNVMLKEWTVHPALWSLTEGYINLVANTTGYSLTPRPYRIIAMRYRNAAGVDLPMTEMTRQDYYDLPLKYTTGIPTQWHFDPQRGTSSIYIWQALASVTTETLRVTYQRRYEDVDDVSNDLDIPQEHFSTVMFNLAARLADNYGRKGEHINRIIQRAAVLEKDMKDADRPEFITFEPDSRYR